MQTIQFNCSWILISLLTGGILYTQGMTIGVVLCTCALSHTSYTHMQYSQSLFGHTQWYAQHTTQDGCKLKMSICPYTSPVAIWLLQRHSKAGPTYGIYENSWKRLRVTFLASEYQNRGTGVFLLVFFWWYVRVREPCVTVYCNN